MDIKTKLSVTRGPSRDVNTMWQCELLVWTFSEQDPLNQYVFYGQTDIHAYYKAVVGLSTVLKSVDFINEVFEGEQTNG